MAHLCIWLSLAVMCWGLLLVESSEWVDEWTKIDSTQSNFQHTTVEISHMLTGREKERTDMQKLNGRFAKYISEVRYLEAQNKKLSKELQKLQESCRTETEKIRVLYEERFRKQQVETNQYKADREMSVTSLEIQLKEWRIHIDQANRLSKNDRETIDKLNLQIAKNDVEISQLSRRIASFNGERARDLNEIERLSQSVNRFRNDWNMETLAHIKTKHAVESLREEIVFLKSLHDSELKTAITYRDTTGENREYWNDIQREYDEKLEKLEYQYSIKVQEARTFNMELNLLKEENERIKSQIGGAKNRIPELESRNSQLEELHRTSELEKNQLRADLASANSTLAEYLRELHSLTNVKSNLEVEIHAYRDLLEGEELRINQTSGSNQSSDSSWLPVNILKGQMTAKTSLQRTTEGTVAIQECDSDGKFVVLEFNGEEEEDLSNWTLVRNVDNEKQIVKFTFPKGVVLDSTNKNVKIWAKGLRPADNTADLELDEASWGVGNRVVTLLSNAYGEEKATHTLTTTYSTD